MLLSIIAFYHPEATYSPTRLGQTQIPQNHVFLERSLFPLSNSSVFYLKMYSVVKQIREFNKDSSSYSPLFTIQKWKSRRNEANLGSVHQNLMFVLLLQVCTEPNYRLNSVNNLLSRPVIKNINGCTNNAFIYFF